MTRTVHKISCSKKQVVQCTCTVLELSSEKASLFRRISKFDFPTWGLPRRTTKEGAQVTRADWVRY